MLLPDADRQDLQGLAELQARVEMLRRAIAECRETTRRLRRAYRARLATQLQTMDRKERLRWRSVYSEASQAAVSLSETLQRLERNAAPSDASGPRVTR